MPLCCSAHNYTKKSLCQLLKYVQPILSQLHGIFCGRLVLQRSRTPRKLAAQQSEHQIYCISKYSLVPGFTGLTFVLLTVKVIFNIKISVKLQKQKNSNRCLRCNHLPMSQCCVSNLRTGQGLSNLSMHKPSIAVYAISTEHNTACVGQDLSAVPQCMAL